MAGIISYGAYIPVWRLSRGAIAGSWGKRSMRGERSVANFDEDSTTMSVEACVDCLGSLERQNIDGLYFASTTPPYKEKECATLVATATDLRPEIMTTDFGNSLRAGTAGFRAALDAVNAGSAGSILLTASDSRIGYPGSNNEQSFGDAAATLLIGNTTNPAVVVEGRFSISNELYDVWRLDKDTYVQNWEDRFIIEHGYTENMQKAVSALMERQGLSPKDISKAILYAPTARAQRTLARNLGFDLEAQLQDLLIDNVGVSGCAHSLLMLIAALEEARPGERFILASYGNGADAFLLRVTEGIDKIKDDRKGLNGFLNSRKSFPSYAKYLSYKGLVEPEPGEPLKLFPASTVSWRERNWAIRMHGSKCKDCGTVHFPIERVCYNCGSKDNYEEVRLSDKKARVFTYTLDNLATARSDEPAVPQLTIEFEEGNARAYLLVTDYEPEEVKVDMPVEMTFRRMYEGRNMYTYYWKCRPIR